MFVGSKHNKPSTDDYLSLLPLLVVVNAPRRGVERHPAIVACRSGES